MYFPLKDDSVEGLKKQLAYWRGLNPKTQPQARMKALALFKLTSKLAVASNP